MLIDLDQDHILRKDQRSIDRQDHDPEIGITSHTITINGGQGQKVIQDRGQILRIIQRNADQFPVNDMASHITIMRRNLDLEVQYSRDIMAEKTINPGLEVQSSQDTMTKSLIKHHYQGSRYPFLLKVSTFI